MTARDRVGDSEHLSRVEDDFTREYPGADATASEAYVNIVRVGDRLESELSRRLRHEASLSTTSIMVLATIDGLGGQSTPGVIGAHVPITSAAITSLIDTNERKGLVARRADPDDRRKVQIVLTAEGRALTDRLLPGIHQHELEVMTALTPREQKTLLRLLEKVQRSVNRVAEQPPSLAPAQRIRPERLTVPNAEPHEE